MFFKQKETPFLHGEKKALLFISSKYLCIMYNIYNVHFFVCMFLCKTNIQQSLANTWTLDHSLESLLYFC